MTTGFKAFGSWCAAFGMAMLLLGTAHSARADVVDGSVLVLGLRSIEGDDETALKLSHALRQAAAEVEGWQLREQAVTLTQMSLAHGCDEVDAHCLADIARALSTDLLLFGSMRRTRAGEDFSWSVRLEVFDARTGGIEGEASTIFSQGKAAQDIDSVANDLLTQLLPPPLVPEVVVQTNVPGAEVRLNGQLMGQVQGDRFVMEDLEAGRYLLLVSALGYEAYEQDLELVAGQATTIEATLEPTALLGAQGAAGSTGERWEVDEAPSDGGVPVWLPASLLVLSGASVAATVGSWVAIASIEDDPLYQRYSGAVYTDTEVRMQNGEDISFSDVDICARAADGDGLASGGNSDTQFSDGDLKDLQGMCNTADTLEVLQYVFLGVAGVSAATAIVLLLVDDSGEDTRNAALQPSLTLRPDINMQQAGVSATLRF